MCVRVCVCVRCIHMSECVRVCERGREVWCEAEWKCSLPVFLQGSRNARTGHCTSSLYPSAFVAPRSPSRVPAVSQLLVM